MSPVETATAPASDTSVARSSAVMSIAPPVRRVEFFTCASTPLTMALMPIEPAMADFCEPAPPMAKPMMVASSVARTLAEPVA